MKTLRLKPKSTSIKKSKKVEKRTRIKMNPTMIDNKKKLQKLQKKLNQQPMSAVDQHLTGGINS